MLTREQKKKMFDDEMKELERVGEHVFPSGPMPTVEFDLSVLNNKDLTLDFLDKSGPVSKMKLDFDPTKTNPDESLI